MSSDSRPPQEFRESTRAPVQAPATLQLDAFSEPLSGLTANVSVGGMFVKMADQPAVGSIVKFLVELGSPPTPVRGTAEVVWMRTEASGADRPAGVGLQFRFIEGNGQAILESTVIKALAEAGPEPPPPPKKKPAPRRPRPGEPLPAHLRERPVVEEPASPSKGKKKPKKPKPAGQGDNQKLILGLPAEKAKLIILLVLTAILLVSFLL